MVYPNPATTDLHVAITLDKQQEATITLSDMTGKIFFVRDRLLHYGENTIREDVSAFAKGIYLLTLTTESGKMISRISVE